MEITSIIEMIRPDNEFILDPVTASRISFNEKEETKLHFILPRNHTNPDFSTRDYVDMARKLSISPYMGRDDCYTKIIRTLRMMDDKYLEEEDNDYIYFRAYLTIDLSKYKQLLMSEMKNIVLWEEWRNIDYFVDKTHPGFDEQLYIDPNRHLFQTITLSSFSNWYNGSKVYSFDLTSSNTLKKDFFLRRGSIFTGSKYDLDDKLLIGHYINGELYMYKNKRKLIEQIFYKAYREFAVSTPDYKEIYKILSDKKNEGKEIKIINPSGDALLVNVDHDQSNVDHDQSNVSEEYFLSLIFKGIEI